VAPRLSTPAASFVVVPLAQLREHPLNPRKRFDEVQLAELARSIKEKGILNPLLVRPRANGGTASYEILAGARRFRASKIAGVPDAPVIVREMDDVAALELLVIDNDQREDVHPLEEAEGYRQLMARGKYDVARIAARIGRSVKYVYDRVKLLSLTKDAQKAFLEGKMTAGHAILLARLQPKDQERAMVVDRGGVFEHERLIWDPEVDRSAGRAMRREEAVKPVSVRELASWIDKNVRFDAAAPDPMIFPETALTLTTSREEAEKIVPITHDHYVPPEAKDGTRTYGPTSWRRADGKSKSKTCERSVTGVIVIGPGRGEAFKVCIDKEHCTVHWGAEIRGRKQRAAAVANPATKSGAKSQQDYYERQRRKDEEERKRAEAERVRWKKAAPAILEAIAERVKRLPADATGLLADTIMGDIRGQAQADRYVARGRSAEDLVRYAAFQLLYNEATNEWVGPREFPKIAKAFGVDVKKILDEVAPLPESEKKAASAKARKK
jgi:ParB family chromosome partitioning protein